MVFCCYLVTFFLDFIGLHDRIIHAANSHITLDALLCACSIYNIPRGVLGTTVNSDTCRIRVDGRIRFEYVTCGREFFLIRNKKYPDSKISGYVWTGP